MGIVIDPVPVTGFAANFSPIPRIAPPPLGIMMAGAVIWKEFRVASLPLVSFPLASGTSVPPFGFIVQGNGGWRVACLLL